MTTPAVAVADRTLMTTEVVGMETGPPGRAAFSTHSQTIVRVVDTHPTIEVEVEVEVETVIVAAAATPTAAAEAAAEPD